MNSPKHPNLREKKENENLPSYNTKIFTLLRSMKGRKSSRIGANLNSSGNYLDTRIWILQERQVAISNRREREGEFNKISQQWKLRIKEAYLIYFPQLHNGYDSEPTVINPNKIKRISKCSNKTILNIYRKCKKCNNA